MIRRHTEVMDVETAPIKSLGFIIGILMASALIAFSLLVPLAGLM